MALAWEVSLTRNFYSTLESGAFELLAVAMLLIRNSEVEGVSGLDVRCRRGRIVEIGRLVPAEGERVVDADGGALLPGLHDHHLHFFALAAAQRSVRCGPPEVTDAAALEAALRYAPGDGWIRGVGYHESVAGRLDRARLDGMVADRPLRIQHRSGKMWFVNTAAAQALGLGPESNGRLFRRDRWLGTRVDGDVDVAATTRLLASCGVTGFTDATPHNDPAAVRDLVAAAPLQHVVAMGDESLSEGALKIMLDDFDLPGIDALRTRMAGAHAAGRPVAVHCVTRTELVFALSTLLEAGAVPEDRIEHASVADAAAMELLARAGVTVVTQPNFVAERGDRYLAEVPASDHAHLYRGQGFLDAGIPLGGGTDTPFGDPDPWLAIRAAVTRETPSGKALGAGEALTPERALALFTTPPEEPGGAPRRVRVGEAADLCLLDRPWSRARLSLSRHLVAATVRAGEVTYAHSGTLAPMGAATPWRQPQ